MSARGVGLQRSLATIGMSHLCSSAISAQTAMLLTSERHTAVGSSMSRRQVQCWFSSAQGSFRDHAP